MICSFDQLIKLTTYVIYTNYITYIKQIQCNLDLETLHLVTTCNLVAIFQQTIYSIYYYTKQKPIYSVTLYNLMTVFVETKSVTRSRVHCKLYHSEPDKMEAKLKGKIFALVFY